LSPHMHDFSCCKLYRTKGITSKQNSLFVEQQIEGEVLRHRSPLSPSILAKISAVNGPSARQVCRIP
jgi:hypothetical protein